MGGQRLVNSSVSNSFDTLLFIPEAVQCFTLMDTFSGIQILEHGEVEKKNETK